MLEEIVYNLTSLQVLYRDVYELCSLSITEVCASDALVKSNQEEAARTCVNRHLERYYSSTETVETILLSVEQDIKQALRIIPTCTKRALKNATLSVNDLIWSIKACLQRFNVEGIKIKTVSFYLYSKC